MRGQYLARGFEVGRGVDAARHGVDNSDVDPHAGLERPQLFQLLLLLQRRGRQSDEAFERRAAISIEADVMVARAFAVGRSGAGEIERAQPPGADQRADCLHDVGIRGLFLGVDFRSQRRDIDLGVGERHQHIADIVRAYGRKIALQIDDDLGLPARIEGAERLKNPVRTGRVVGAGHDGFPAMGGDHGGDLGRVGCDRDPADFGGFRPAQHVDDHRQASHLQQRLAGQARGGHAGRNQHQNTGIDHQEVGPGPTVRKWWGLVKSQSIYTGCQSTGKPISDACLGCGAKGRFLALSAAVSRRPKVDIPGLEPDPKWTPSNSIKFSVPFSVPASFCW